MACVLLVLASMAWAEDTSDLDVDPLLEDWPGLEDVDASTLLDLDALLQHPVRLNAADVHRLHWIPWITAAQWRSLQQALPIDSAEAWSRLQGWSPQEVQRLRPFVVFPVRREPRRPRSTPFLAESDMLFLRSGNRLRVQGQGSGLRVTLQARRDALAEAAGALTWESPELLVHVGDQRRSTALGLLWSSRLQSTRAGGAVRSAPRWSASSSAWRDRVVRGVGLAWEHRSVTLGLQSGEHQGASLHGVSLQWQRRQARLQMAMLHRQRASWVALAAQQGMASAQVGSELVLQPAGMAMAFFARRTSPWLGLESLLIVAPRGVSSPLASTPRSARDVGWMHVRARATWSDADTRVRLSWSQSTWNAADSRRQNDLSVQAWRHVAVLMLEIHWRAVRDAERPVDAESLGDDELQRGERLLLRARLQVGKGQSVLLERRSRQAQPGSGRAEPARGWRLAWRQQSGQQGLDASVAFFDAVAGESIVFSEPAVGRAPALYYGSTRGMRLALRLRRAWYGVRVSVRAAASWDAVDSWQPLVEAALRLRTPERSF